METDRAKVWVVENAVSEEECALLNQESRPAQLLTQAETNSDGSSTLLAPPSTAPAGTPKELQLSSSSEGGSINGKSVASIEHYVRTINAESPEKDALW